MVSAMSSNATEPARSDPSFPKRRVDTRLRELARKMYAQRAAIDRGREGARRIPTFTSPEERDAWWASERRRLDELERIQEENWRRREEAEKASHGPHR